MPKADRSGRAPAANRFYNRILKRLLDLILAALALILLSPLILLAALAVKLSSPGPVIFRQERIAQFESRFALLEALHPDGWLVRTMGELEYLNTHGAAGKRIADSHCYVFNDLAAHVLAEAGADEVTYSLELNAGELAHLAAAGEDGAALPCILEVYGRAPLMLSANCVRGDAAAAGGSLSCPGDRGFTALTDRKGAKLPVESFCGRDTA